MPAYDISTTAFAIAAQRKWVDNVTSHHHILGVESKQRGIQREFSFDAVVLLSVIHVINTQLHVPIGRAVELATQASSDPGGRFQLPGGIAISLDTSALARQAQQRLLEAIESVPRARRGRPRQLAK